MPFLSIRKSPTLKQWSCNKMSADLPENLLIVLNYKCKKIIITVVISYYIHGTLSEY